MGQADKRRWCVAVTGRRSNGHGEHTIEVYCGDESVARVVRRAFVAANALFPNIRVRLEYRAPTPPAAHPLLVFRRGQWRPRVPR